MPSSGFSLAERPLGTFAHILAGMEAEAPMLSGRAVVPAHDCCYPPAVDVADLLRVDFNRRDIGLDGLYLVEELGPAGVVWRGCRRFIRLISGTVQMDADGQGGWVDANLTRWGWRVAGYVEEVYKPASERAGRRA